MATDLKPQAFWYHLDGISISVLSLYSLVNFLKKFIYLKKPKMPTSDLVSQIMNDIIVSVC